MSSSDNEMISIAIIKYSDNFIDLNKSIDQKIHDINEIIEDPDIIQLIKIKKKDLIKTVMEYVKPEGNLLTGSKTYIGDYLYQTMFEAVSNVVNIDYDKINKIGTQFTGGIETYKPIILAKFRIVADYEVDTVSLSKNNLCEFLEDRFIKTGIVLHNDNKMDIYKYSQNHLDNFMEKFGLETVKQNFKYYEKQIFDMIFIIAEDTRHNDSDSINEIASKIAGKSLYGDVYCSLYYKPDDINNTFYISIDNELCKKILFLIQKDDFDPTNDGEYINYTKENLNNELLKDKSQCVISSKSIIERVYNKYSTSI